jgi:cystathionine gamma-synthase
MKGFGGILSFLLKENSLDAVGRFIPHLRFAHAAGNLGAVETIVAPPATSSSAPASTPWIGTGTA